MTYTPPELALMDKHGFQVVPANHGSEQDTSTDWADKYK